MSLIEKIKKKIISFLDPKIYEELQELELQEGTTKSHYISLEKQFNELIEEQNNSDKEWKEKLEEKENTIKYLEKNISKTIIQKTEKFIKSSDLEFLEYLYRHFNYETEYFKKIYSESKMYDIKYEIELSKGDIIDDISEELLGEEPIWSLFPEEDARGTFEATNGYEDTRWREKYHFGRIVDSYFINNYEFCKYKIDKNKTEYIEYKKELYQRAIIKEIERYATYILREEPEILQKPLKHFEKLKNDFENEMVFKKESEIEYREILKEQKKELEETEEDEEEI